MEELNKGLEDLPVPSDVALGVVGGSTLKSVAYAPPVKVEGVKLDTKQLEFLARSNLFKALIDFPVHFDLFWRALLFAHPLVIRFDPSKTTTRPLYRRRLP